MDQKLKILKNALSNTKNALTDSLMGTPPAEIWVREATTDESILPSSTLLHKISDGTKNSQHFSIIMDSIMKRISDTDDTVVYKALFLLDYLIKNGSDRVASAVKSAYLYRISQLTTSFTKNYNSHSKDIRERSKLIIDLLNNDKKLKEERKKAEQIRYKFFDSINSDNFSSFSRSQSYSRNGYGYKQDNSRYEEVKKKETTKRDELKEWNPFDNETNTDTPTFEDTNVFNSNTDQNNLNFMDFKPKEPETHVTPHTGQNISGISNDPLSFFNNPVMSSTNILDFNFSNIPTNESSTDLGGTDLDLLGTKDAKKTNEKVTTDDPWENNLKMFDMSTGGKNEKSVCLGSLVN